MVTRRGVMIAGALSAGGWLATRSAGAAEVPGGARKPWESSYSGGDPQRRPEAPAVPGRDYRPVTTPNGATLPFRVVDGVKVFHLVAEDVEHAFTPAFKAKCWGYNGRVHGPTIEAVEGDRVRIYVENRLPAATTVHWHGIFLPNGMDGVGGLTQPVIQPGETFRYELTLRQHGTFMYHSHHDEMTQMALGLMGMFVVHPRRASADYAVDRDFALLVSEWRIPVGASRPDPSAMSDFNVLTINAKCFPATAPLVCKKGDRVRIRIGNLSAMDHHSMHLHGHYFRLTATDGGVIPLSAQWPESTVLVPVGSTRDIELVTDAEGDWPFHCHMTHHVMNQMGHGLPNTTGVDTRDLDEKMRRVLPDYMTMGQAGMGDMADMKMPVPPNSIPMAGGPGPFGPITMGGMFTLLKVRASVDAQGTDPGPYAHPDGTVARKATADELAKDGVSLRGPTVPPAPPPTSAPPAQPAAAPSAHPHPTHRGHK